MSDLFNALSGAISNLERVAIGNPEWNACEPCFSLSFTLGRMLDRLNSAKDTLRDVDKASSVYTTAFGTFPFIVQVPIHRMHYRITFLLVAASKVAIPPLCWWCYCSRATCKQNYAELLVGHSRSKTCRLASALDFEFSHLSSSPYGHWKPVRVSLSGLGEMNKRFTYICFLYQLVLRPEQG